ncbi:MAG: amidohydrolase [Comamonadaceae bacterium]|nr:amidohydrolase [Comamonadaceae bacterium]
MSDCLIQNATVVLTGLAGERARLPQGQCDVRVRRGKIQAIGAFESEPGEVVYDASNCVLAPGWVNTHHHLFQSLLKGVPAGLNVRLAEWLAAVPVRHRRAFDHEAVFRMAVRVGLSELLLSGCTTVADHQYHHYPGMPFDPTAVVFDEAGKLGVRMVVCRGVATQVRQIDATPSPQIAPEPLDLFFRKVADDAARFNDTAPDAMRRVVVAPTTPNWSVKPDELREIARFARSLKLRMHSHLSETADYGRHTAEAFGCTPLDFVERHEWVGPDVWFAHLVWMEAAEQRLLAQSGTGMAHCPQCNARLGSGTAPVVELLRLGAKVSLGVDGAASNEAADMLSEVHMAYLMHRLRHGPDALSTDDVVRMATAGGAEVLGLPGIGTIEVGQVADLASYRLDSVAAIGLHDPGSAPVLCGRALQTDTVWAAGKPVVQRGEIPGLDRARLAAHAREAVQQIVQTVAS